MKKSEAKNKDLEAHVTSLKHELEVANQLETENKARIVSLTKEIAESKKSSDDTESQKVNLTEIEKEFKSKIASLENKLKKTVPKTELDDLMLLMSDIDDKKDKYKEKLKALGEKFQVTRKMMKMMKKMMMKTNISTVQCK